MDRLDWFKIIAAYEIIGGIIGIVIASYIVASMHTVPAAIVIGVFFVLLFLLSTYAGTLLWKNDVRGIDLSIIAQIPQIFQITIPGILTYRFISGLSFPLIFEFDQARGSSSFDFSLGLLSSFNFQLGPEKDVSLLGINLVAIAAIMYLIGLRKSGFPASPTNADSDVDCTPDSRQLVKQRYLKQTPLRTVLEIYSQELNAASSCCTPSQ